MNASDVNRYFLWLILVIACVGVGVYCMIAVYGRPVCLFPEYERQMQNIRSAMEKYRVEYGYYPKTTDSFGREEDTELLLAVLTASTNNLKTLKLNNREIRFLNWYTNRARGLGDPWGHPYHIILNPGTNAISVGKFSVKAEVIIWSNGPNGINEFGLGDDKRNWDLSPPDQR